ncbi:MAG: hypothetical protein LAO79_19265 [Acidobacteriia bacterium]|nr:hypothetical protein [Terriglobia bacterium]
MIALKCARGLGFDSEDDWLDELRLSEVVKFRPSGTGRSLQDDGTMLEERFGHLKDVVQHSITLCHLLEAQAPDFAGEIAPRREAVEGKRANTRPSELGLIIHAPDLTKGRKPGPKRDRERALQVKEIVARFAPDGDWRSKLDEICEALDERGVPFPKSWKSDGCRSWSDCTERQLVIKAIDYRLRTAALAPE